MVRQETTGPRLLLHDVLLTVIGNPSKAIGSRGISLVSFITALATSLVVFGIQTGIFLILRNKLARILYANPTDFIYLSLYMDM